AVEGETEEWGMMLAGVAGVDLIDQGGGGLVIVIGAGDELTGLGLALAGCGVAGADVEAAGLKDVGDLVPGAVILIGLGVQAVEDVHAVDHDADGAQADAGVRAGLGDGGARDADGLVFVRRIGGIAGEGADVVGWDVGGVDIDVGGIVSDGI